MRLWYAVYTKYRAEKFVAGQLSKKGLESYVPLLVRTKRYSRKIVEVSLPLISCYVFVRITPEERISVLETEYVYDFVKFSGSEVPIPEGEIELLKRIAGEKCSLIAEKSDYCEGDLVEVIRGNLTGLTGKVIRSNGKKELLIELEHIGYSLRMKVDCTILRELPLTSVS